MVIAGGFYPNYFSRTRPNKREYHKEIQRDLYGNDPFTSVVFQGFPMEQPGELYVVYSREILVLLNFMCLLAFSSKLNIHRYAKPIANSVTFRSCIPKLTFNSSKVVVTFESRGCYIGPISAAVYRAVKMRQLRQSVQFPTPW